MTTAEDVLARLRRSYFPARRHGVNSSSAFSLKRTYDIVPGKGCVRANEDRKLVAGDQHYGDPMNSTAEFEADFVPFKLATDVVLNGKAYAPCGQPTATFTASLCSQVAP